MLHLTKENFASEVKEHKGLVIIDLYADWCGPCKMLSPVIEELAQELPNVKFAKINVDEEPELARMFNAMSIPMIVAYNYSDVLDVTVGYQTKDSLRNFINEYTED